METLTKMQQHYKQRDMAARQWKEKGGRVIGYLCNMVPEEIIQAAGFLPWRISGNPYSGTELADRYTEPSYEPDIRSILNSFLDGSYDFLDYAIIPHSRDAVYKLYAHLRRISEMEPEISFPEIHFFDMCHTSFWLSTAYTQERLQELKKKVEKWAGKKISNKALSQAIEITNSNRVLLEQVKVLRELMQPRISGVEAMQIIGSSMFMPKEEHNKLLSRLLEERNQFPARSGLRVFISGSPLDNLQFYEILESYEDVTVVAEDNCWGNCYFESKINTALEPMEAILDKYFIRALCPQMFPISTRLEYVAQGAERARADGAIFYFLEWDNAALWEFPEQKKLLDKKGIPTLCLTMQPYLPTGKKKEGLKNSIEEFIAHIKHRKENG